jgi:hypothetical protein
MTRHDGRCVACSHYSQTMTIRRHTDDRQQKVDSGEDERLKMMASFSLLLPPTSVVPLITQHALLVCISDLARLSCYCKMLCKPTFTSVHRV